MKYLLSKNTRQRAKSSEEKLHIRISVKAWNVLVLNGSILTNLNETIC